MKGKRKIFLGIDTSLRRSYLPGSISLDDIPGISNPAAERATIDIAIKPTISKTPATTPKTGIS